MKATGISDLSITPGARFETGCIATLSDGTSRHFVGDGTAATRAVAEYCDGHGVTVVSLSTPRTIYRDLQGTRATLEDSGETPVQAVAGAASNMVNRPEYFMLSRIGRLDLLERSSDRAATPHEGVNR